MKAAIYSPYLDTLGGGEKYMMSIVQYLIQSGFDVDVLLDNHLDKLGADNLKNNLTKRFDLDIKRSVFIKSPFGRNSSVINRIFFLKNYDLFFYLTDGSIFYPTARKNILHIQSPLVGQPAKSIWGKFKLKGWDMIIYNSKFTRDNSAQNWPIQSEVIYPPVDVDKIKPLEKKNYILSVGRFFGFLKDKKQAVLISVFKQLLKNSVMKDWVLNLAGSAGEGDKKYIEELLEMAKGLPVKIYPNLEYNKLIKLYGESRIYWHASGFEEGDPVKMEHFGISTVEAMAAGCVPVVIAKGGQKEIVENEKSGYLWKDLNELINLTLKLVRNEELIESFSKESVKRAKYFNKENFNKAIEGLIKN